VLDQYFGRELKVASHIGQLIWRSYVPEVMDHPVPSRPIPKLPVSHTLDGLHGEPGIIYRTCCWTADFAEVHNEPVTDDRFKRRSL
jgi:hypothetical protein